MFKIRNRRALVLTGGGARGAYQAGVLKFIGEKIPEARFNIITGSSAGALNVGILASEAGNLKDASEKLCSQWGNLSVPQVFKVDALSLLWIGLHWLYDLVLGGLLGRSRVRSLVDTSPLLELLRKIYNPEVVRKALEEKKIDSIAITATEVSSGMSVTFVQGFCERPWRRARRRSEKALLSPEHFHGSAAIPFLFPSVQVGQRHYVDGCVRATAPFGPAARLGATHIFAIGMRRVDTPIMGETPTLPEAERPPTPAHIGGLVLNSIFYDNLDSDAEHLLRINSLLEATGLTSPEDQERLGMRTIRVLLIQPSEDLGAIAKRYAHRMPLMLRYFMRGLGSRGTKASDVMSYLLFDAEYAQYLINLGYKDATQKEAEIKEFFKTSG